jgi:Flp pilus assembly protein CpaB
MEDLHVVIGRVRRVLLRFRRPIGAVLAALVVYAVIETVAPETPQQAPVVVAAHDLSAGVTVSPSDVRVVELPPGVAPDSSARSIEDVVGRLVAGPMRGGEVLTDRRLVGPSLLAGYPAGLVAAPVRINDSDAAGLLQVGDRVDVYAARRDSSPADLVAAAARVVTLPRSSDDSSTGALVVLAVSAAEAAVLAQASATAPLSVALLR